MQREAVILALSFFTISAFPLHRDTREATWADWKANQAHVKPDLAKEEHNVYKSHLDSSSLYSQEGDRLANPVAEEMQHKLLMESERLRARLRQELAELQERLSPSPAHPSSPLPSVREILAPLTQQLHASVSGNTRELYSQLSLYLQDLDAADAQAGEAVHWMTQALDRSGSKLASDITDLHSKTAEAIERCREISANGEDADVWQALSSRLGQEVSSLRVAMQNTMAALKAELAALLETSAPPKAEVTASVERFCQKAASISQAFHMEVDKLVQELEEQRSAASLHEDLSVKLSALIHDIVHSVVTEP